MDRTHGKLQSKFLEHIWHIMDYFCIIKLARFSNFWPVKIQVIFDFVNLHFQPLSNCPESK